jgi:chaperonin cofactor prefoldin
MSKSRFVIDKFAKLLEQGLLNYKDLSNEILNILKSKRDEIVFKMKLTSKEETDILNKRLENLEKKVETLEKTNKKKKKKTKRVKRS